MDWASLMLMLTPHMPSPQEELLEVVDFFLKPQRFRRSGAKIPRGILLCGPPGAWLPVLASGAAAEY